MQYDRTIWIPAVPHTRPTPGFSHCAFTTKVRLLPKLLKLAYPNARIRYCGVRDDLLEGVDDYVPIWNPEQWERWFGRHYTDERQFVGAMAHVDHPGYRDFNAKYANYLSGWLEAGDIVCFPFGHAHQAAWAEGGRQGVVAVETGIGYPAPFLPFRIYESAAWMHYVAGKSGCEGSDYHFVAPHYYDLAEWPLLPKTEPGPIVYMGRLAESKGLSVVRAIAEAMPEREFVMYGQGDPTPWEGRNLRYGGVLHGDQRREALSAAGMVLCPTRYIEPFCQTHVEALLCGTPVSASPYGVFLEHKHMGTLPRLVLPRTLDQWVSSVSDYADPKTEYRATIARCAGDRFALESVAPLYRYAIDTMLETLTPAGWYGTHHRPAAPALTPVEV